MATACNAPDVDKGTDYVFQNIDEEFVLLKKFVILVCIQMLVMNWYFAT